MKRESTTTYFFLEVLENGIERFVSGYRMIVIKVIIDSSFLVNMKTFYCVKKNTLFSGTVLSAWCCAYFQKYIGVL